MDGNNSSNQAIGTLNKESFFKKNKFLLLISFVFLTFIAIFITYLIFDYKSGTEDEASEVVNDNQVYNNVDKKEKEILLKTLPEDQRLVATQEDVPMKGGTNSNQVIKFIKSIDESNDSVSFTITKPGIARVEVINSGNKEILYLGYGKEFDIKKITGTSINQGETYNIIILDTSANNIIEQTGNTVFRSNTKVR